MRAKEEMRKKRGRNEKERRRRERRESTEFKVLSSVRGGGKPWDEDEWDGRETQLKKECVMGCKDYGEESMKWEGRRERVREGGREGKCRWWIGDSGRRKAGRWMPMRNWGVEKNAENEEVLGRRTFMSDGRMQGMGKLRKADDERQGGKKGIKMQTQRDTQIQK